MQIHQLKIWPKYFDAVLSGAKTFEVRNDDRGFAVGDTLVLREWSRMPSATLGAGYTGRECKRVVTHILCGGNFGVQEGYVVMGLSDPVKDEEIARLRKIEETAKYMCIAQKLFADAVEDSDASELERASNRWNKATDRLVTLLGVDKP